MDTALRDLALRAGAALQAAGLTLATAESCTGGGIGAVVTMIAGSSAWYEGGFVTYSNGAKQALLGVPAEVLARHGAVSEATVTAMVEGTLSRLPADLGVAVSGVAGPGGGTAAKPVGMVCIAWGGRGTGIEARTFHFPGDRDAVRRQTVIEALEGVIRRCAAPAAA